MKFGIIGSNFVVDSFLESAKLIEDFEFTAMYSRDINRAKEFGGKYGAKFFYDDLEDMYKSGIEAVYIASPMALHEEQAIMALNAGIHVLCEKIATTTVDSFERIKKTAELNGKLFMEAMISTATPTFKNIKENLNRIGKIRRVVFQFNQYSSRYDKLKNGIVKNAFKPELGNGALTDIGVYTIEPIINLFGKPKSIVGNNYKLSTGAISHGSAILGYEGFEAIVMYSKICNSYSNSEIIGEDGSILINKISLPDSYEIIFRNGSKESFKDNSNMPLMYYEIKEFIQCIKDGKTESAINSLSTTKETIRVVEYLWNN